MDMTSSAIRIALLASAFGAGLAVSSADAQDNGYPDESVTVASPHFRSNADGARLNGPLERVSLSSLVRTDDLDLRSGRGARELRLRVRDAAQGVCTQLADAYPLRQMNGTSCYKDALQNGMLRANEAITNARFDRYRD
jgi:UrcA family protein